MPAGVVVVVDTVKVDETDPLAGGVTDASAKEQVTVALVGAIAQLNATDELNPLRDATVIVEVDEFPAIVVADAGEELKLKSAVPPPLTVKA